MARVLLLEWSRDISIFSISKSPSPNAPFPSPAGCCVPGPAAAMSFARGARTRSGRLYQLAEAPDSTRQGTAAGTGRHPLASAQDGTRQGTAAGTRRQPPPPVFACRRDVDALLKEKMKGKNKMDYKGKSEQMMEYIIKLRACIKWLLEREDANIADIEKRMGLLESAEKQHSEMVAEMTKLLNSIKKTISRNKELEEQYASLQQILKMVEAEKDASLQHTLKMVEDEKMDALRALGDEKEARTAVESSRDGILEELAKAKLEIKMLQDTNRRLQEHEYNTSLQQDT